MIFVSACGLIGTISSVDVDRDYLQDIAIVLQSFFFYLMYPGTMAAVWEAVRHWYDYSESLNGYENANTFCLGDRGRNAKSLIETSSLSGKTTAARKPSCICLSSFTYSRG